MKLKLKLIAVLAGALLLAGCSTTEAAPDPFQVACDKKGGTVQTHDETMSGMLWVDYKYKWVNKFDVTVKACVVDNKIKKWEVSQ